MITGQLRSRIDKLWEEFWTGGITNPLTVIEQISYLMFCRLLDQAEAVKASRARRLGKPHASIYPKPPPDDPDIAFIPWSVFSKIEDAERMLKVVRDKVFPFLRGLGGKDTAYGRYMADATLMIVSPQLMYRAVGAIGRLPLQGDRKGDLYEYLLGKLNTAGINGQFRTPRHIIQCMVDLLDPHPDQVIGDPACGTGGFLVAVIEYLYRKHTSPAGIVREPDPDSPGGERTIYTGDLLEAHIEHVRKRMLYGFDFDVTMLRIGAMNLMLHGIDSPNVFYQNSLSGSFFERYPEQARDAFDVILANPPFAGNVDDNDIEPSLTRLTKTRKTELLFLALILRMLKPAGRAAVIVPHGVLFGGSKAHVALRKHLVEDNQLEAVISLPGGVFKPYAGVSTAILVFAKSGRTDNVWFYDVRNDGYSLSDTRVPIEENDLPDLVARWGLRDTGGQAFLVSRSELAAKVYVLLSSRYRQAELPEYAGATSQQLLARLLTTQDDLVREATLFREESPSLAALSVTCRLTSIGLHVEECTEAIGDLAPEEAVHFQRLRGVSNIQGIVDPPFDRIRPIKDPARYIVLRKNYFAYNPMRINVGSLGFVRNQGDEGKISPDYVVFRTKPTLLPEYLFAYLKSPVGLRLIRSGTSGAVRERLYFRDLCQLPLPFPSLRDQQRIADLLQRAARVRLSHEHSTEALNELLTALFTGMHKHCASSSEV